jgi:KUP system potassium uptake protein
MDAVVLPITLAILVVLFAVQSRGTENVARFFGPLTLIWFIALAIGGLIHIVDDVRVFQALNPLLGVQFIMTHGVIGLAVMGLIFLVATGAEALYADLGHFGRRPIQVAWLWVVQPALILNYFGQGALLLAEPEAIENPFYRLYPSWALIPMVILATVATVIASQAVITGAYSFTRQAIQLGCCRDSPSATPESGRADLPLRVNQLLFVGVLPVTLTFRSSGELAAAYGLSVTATMVVDSLMAFFVVWRCWGWPVWKVSILIVPLLMIEQAFLTANILKIPEGGWLPLMVAGMIILCVLTWVRGSASLARATRKNEAELDWLVRKLEAKPRIDARHGRLPDRRSERRADLPMHNLKHNRAAERNIILTIKTEDTRACSATAHRDRARGRHLHSRITTIPWRRRACRKSRSTAGARTSTSTCRPPRSSCRGARQTTIKSRCRWQERPFIWLAGRAEDAISISVFRATGRGGTQVTV